MNTPWLPYLAIDYLDNYLKPDMTVFEWGSGGSTIWFAQRVKSVISIEHNPEWTVSLDNVDFHLIQPEDGSLGDNPSNPEHYRARPIGEKNFKKYATAIEQFDQKFDLILIDGRARASCLYHSIDKVKNGGFIIIDNTERDYYLARLASYFEDWNKITFFGNGPKNSWKWETTFFQNE